MKNTPRVRFKGFSGEWEKDFLNNLSHFSKGYGYSKSDLKEIGTPIILYGRLYTNYQTTIDTVNTYAKTNSNSVYSKGNEVLVPSSGETSEDIARASAILQAKVLLGGDLNIITPTDKLNPIFLAFLITYGKPHKELSRLAQGKSVVHLHNSDLQKIEIQYPKTKEQTKIGNFFKNIDTHIAKNQQKHEKLTQMKKALLEKMFPKPGAKKPEIRFQDFSGEWENILIEQLGTIVTGSTPSTSDKSNYNGTHLFVSPVDIQQNRYIEQTATTLSTKGFHLGRILPDGATLFVAIGSTIGKVGQLCTQAVTNQQIHAIVANANFDNDFIFSAVTASSKKIKELASWQAVPIINKTTFGNIKITIPANNQEQAKIGELFRLLDKRIALQQEKIKKLKNMKHAFLEKMFV